MPDGGFYGFENQTDSWAGPGTYLPRLPGSLIGSFQRGFHRDQSELGAAQGGPLLQPSGQALEWRQFRKAAPRFLHPSFFGWTMFAEGRPRAMRTADAPE